MKTRKLIEPTFAAHFVEEWIAGWNEHDLDKILAHYTDDFTVDTPLAMKRLPETKGLIQGKDKIRAYWGEALENNPDLQFKLIDVCYGINCLAIYYESVSVQKQVVENLFFNEDLKVEKAIMMYSN